MRPDDPWFQAENVEDLAPGIYPTLACWDVQEGQFPYSDEWTGSKWRSWATRYYIPTRCESSRDAFDVASRMFPDWSDW